MTWYYATSRLSTFGYEVRNTVVTDCAPFGKRLGLLDLSAQAAENKLRARGYRIIELEDWKIMTNEKEKDIKWTEFIEDIYDPITHELVVKDQLFIRGSLSLNDGRFIEYHAPCNNDEIDKEDCKSLLRITILRHEMSLS